MPSLNKNKRLNIIRSLIAFWIFGLCNNYAYVIMLSAAEDILDKQENKKETKEDDSCEDKTTSRHCTTVSTGAVLLADILPTLVVKFTFPLFMQRIPFGIRHLIICLLQATSYLLVAFSTSVTMSLVGVVFASLGAGLGEITYLSLTPFFNKNTISTWSSGTGGAGVIGALSYAGLTEPHLANLSPKVTLLIMLAVPTIFAFTYWFILVMPETVYEVSILKPQTWIVPKSYMSHAKINGTDHVSDINKSNSIEEKDEKKEENSDEERVLPNDDNFVKQRSLSVPEKLRIVLPLLKFMIPLATVYLGEYLINQGIVQLIFFDCHHGWNLSRSSQYRWYQVTYQVGVFISRSSINIIQLPYPILVLLPILQMLNAVLFFLDALYFFIPHIWILFLLILFEGFFGGSSYVNTFNHIHKYAAPDVREFSLSAGSLGDSVGILIAGLVAIPIHNYICGTPLP